MTSLEDSFGRQSRLMINGMPFALPVTLLTFMLTLRFQSIPIPALFWLSAACAAAIGFWVTWMPWIKRHDASHYFGAWGISMAAVFLTGVCLKPHDATGRENLIALVQYLDIYGFSYFVLVLLFKNILAKAAMQ